MFLEIEREREREKKIRGRKYECDIAGADEGGTRGSRAVGEMCGPGTSTGHQVPQGALAPESPCQQYATRLAS
jgi:hypothetical protein